MKQKLSIFSLFSLLFLLGSCAVQKRQPVVKPVSKTHPKLKFLDDVAIHSGTNALEMKKKKTVYFSENEFDTAEQDEGINLNNLVTTDDTALADFIENWLGTPYQYGGTTKDGIDCSAFSRALYARVYHIHLLRTAFEQFSASIPIFNPKKLKEGDLVFFKIHSRVVSHVGVYLSDGYFVSASGHGVMISSLRNRYWKRYFFAGGRVAEDSTTSG